jgi:peroxiredoxin
MTAYIRKIHFFSILSTIISFISCDKVLDNNYEAYFGGEILNPNSKFVFLCKDNKVIDTIKLDDKNMFLKKYDSLTPGMYTFKHDPEYQHIYFDKNDSLMIRLNTAEFDNSLTFCGRGDEKNNFLVDLFLKNEEDKNKSFGIYDLDFEKFNKSIEADYKIRSAYYTRRKADINWNDDFDLYAKALLDMHYLSKKEYYPLVHKTRTGKDICSTIPKTYYDYRSKINFNDEKLTNYSPFVRYLSSMLNNISCSGATESAHLNEKALENYERKLDIADSLFTNKKIKNAVLNNIAFNYLLEDQNMAQNKAFLDKYLKLSTDSEKQKEIKKIGESTQMLLKGKSLPSVNLIDNNDKVVDLKSIFNKKTVVFFWTSEATSHMVMVHNKVALLQKNHPDWNFMSININDTSKKWKEIVQKHQFKNTIELHATNFQDVKSQWVITKIHRAMLIDKSGLINNAFVSLFDADFENNLK